VAQADGRLDEALIKAARVTVVFGPEIFPDLMGLEEVLPIEK
jgi:hypothetical protein